MRETFLYALNAILPVLLLIALGYTVRRLGPWDGAFYKRLNKLGFTIFMPMNMFINIYGITDLNAVNWRLTGVILAGILLTLVLGIAVAALLRRRDHRGVMVQATFRSNQAILGLPVAQALGGDAATAFASVISGLTVPLFNIMAVLVLVFYSGSKEKRPTLGGMLKQIITNPLVIGSAAAMLILAVRETGLLPAFFLREQVQPVYKVISDLGKIASPVMLFVLGAGLDFRATKKLLPQIGLGVVLRLIVSPVLVIGGALLLRQQLGLTIVEMPSMVAVFASPVAVSSAVMVQEIGGDDQLASQLVVWSSVCSMVTMFVLIYVLRSIGAL